MSYSNIQNIENLFRTMKGIVPKSTGAFIPTSGTSYFVYIGFTTRIITPQFVEFNVNVVGVGAQTAEVGFFSTPLPPNKSGQSLTKIVATGTVDALTSTGVKRNTAAFATAVPRGVHIWAGIRTAMATTQPDITGLGRDNLEGQIFEAVASGALTGAGPFTGTIIVSSTTQAADLRLALD